MTPFSKPSSRTAPPTSAEPSASPPDWPSLRMSDPDRAPRPRAFPARRADALRTNTRSMTGLPPLLGALLALSCYAVLAACQGLLPSPQPRALALAASQAFEEARAWQRASQILDTEASHAAVTQGLDAGEKSARARARSEALAACDRALSIEPEWVAPWRLKDELLRADLRGLEALEVHLASLAEDAGQAWREYLAARLLSAAAKPRFERAALLDPRLSWAWHGLAFVASTENNPSRAIAHERRALRLARDSYERSYFSAALARYLFAANQSEAALAVLRARLEAPDILEFDAIELSVQTARVELSLLFRPQAREGQQRALELLREHDLTDAEVEQLALELRMLRSSDDRESLELELALASRSGRARDRVRAELLLDQRPTPLALGLLRRSRAALGQSTLGGGALLRGAQFAAGAFQPAVEGWLADLPAAVKDAEQLPADPRLAQVVRSVRELDPTPSVAQLARLGEDLLQAGWYGEARSVASALAAKDLDLALSLDGRAAAGGEWVRSTRRLFYSVDERSGARAARGSARAPRTISALLKAWAPIVARAQRQLGGEVDEDVVARDLLASPRIDYGPFAQVVHPGPLFSAADERAGRGRAGARVGGLAQVLERCGRFAIVGQAMGSDPPDAVLLQRVHVSRERGTHLGRGWSGTIAWCDGTDVRSRAGRLGASIAGAALHEGYWIDIESVRRERDEWLRFEQEFFAVEDGRVARALATRGLPLARLARWSAPDRRNAGVLLGQADRVRLAVLRDRARQAPRDGRGFVALDELIENTAIHEQGHLCDRAYFLPLSEHPVRALKFLASVGMNPSDIAARLEYRAELVALCEARDPRTVLVGILRAAEQSESGITPHARAYAQILGDFLAALEGEYARAPKAWPELSPDHPWVHQLHWLAAERVRSLALVAARREGLVR